MISLLVFLYGWILQTAYAIGPTYSVGLTNMRASASTCAQLLTRGEFVQSQTVEGRALQRDRLLKGGQGLGQWWAKTAGGAALFSAASPYVRERIWSAGPRDLPQAVKDTMNFLRDSFRSNWVPPQIAQSADMVFYSEDGAIEGVGFLSFSLFVKFVSDGGVALFSDLGLKRLHLSSIWDEAPATARDLNAVAAALSELAPNIHHLKISYSRPGPFSRLVLHAIRSGMPLETLQLHGRAFGDDIISGLSLTSIPLKHLELIGTAITRASGLALSRARFSLLGIELAHSDGRTGSDPLDGILSQLANSHHRFEALTLFSDQSTRISGLWEFLRRQTQLQSLTLYFDDDASALLRHLTRSQPKLALLYLVSGEPVSAEAFLEFIRKPLPVEYLRMRSVDLSESAIEGLIQSPMPLTYLALDQIEESEKAVITPQHFEALKARPAMRSVWLGSRNSERFVPLFQWSDPDRK